MSEILKTALSLSLSGSLLILLLLVCGRFWRGRVSRQWQYYIWLIVVARLLLPFTPRDSLMGALFQAGGAGGNVGVWESAPLTAYGLGEEAGIRYEGQGGAYTMAEAGSGAMEKTILLLEQNAWLIWLGGAFLLLLRKLTAYRSFVRSVKAGGILCGDAGILDALAALCKQAGIKRPVELCINPAVSSPMLTGFFRPCIILPFSDIPEKEFRFTILHELTHYRRKDMFYKWLVQVTICLHWFNPLVHLMGKEIGRACELACDEAVIAGLDYQEKQDYGRTLLNAMNGAGRSRQELAAITLSENKRLLGERLDAIMKCRKKSKWITVVTVAITVLLAAGSAGAGAYAMPSAGKSGSGKEATDEAEESRSLEKPASALTKRQESLTEDLEPFRSYGIIYEAGSDTVFYNGRPVKMFCDFQDDTSLAFNICYYDGDAGQGALCLMTEHDADWNVTGITELAEEVESLLSEVYEEPKDILSGQDAQYYVFDGTGMADNGSITATDCFEEGVPVEISEWISGCSESGQVYTRKKEEEGMLDFWLCYNGGDRRSFRLEADKEKISLLLLKEAPEKVEGPTVIHLRAPLSYGEPEVFTGNERAEPKR